MKTITVKWGDDAQTYLVWTFDRDWKPEQFYEVFDAGMQMQCAQPHVVDHVFDLSNVFSLNGSIIPMARYTLYHPQRLRHTAILILPSKHMIRMLEIVKRVLPGDWQEQVVRVSTMRDAQQVLKTLRAERLRASEATRQATPQSS